MDLKQQSIQIIKENQADNGAYIACPNFENYKFCWLRDGSFIAYAMDQVGEYQSAERFFQWVNQTLQKYRYKVDSLMIKKHNKEKISKTEYLPTRYTVSGIATNDDWTNFQLDGYGAWLWAYAEHLALIGKSELPTEFVESVETTLTYLSNFWDVPNYDCWEEFGDKIHTATIASIYAGLEGINTFLNRSEIEKHLNKISRFIYEKCIVNNRLIKYVGSFNIDASLLWVCVLLIYFNIMMKL